ncbi:MAG TPA: hypothetical protein VFB08_05200 [Burkholderiales bacterium]|nr:hypothetical protein [Burkholderiales bacterium]
MRYLAAMGYRIDFAVRENLLRAVVSGKAPTKAAAGSIGSDIAEGAKREARRELLVDLRRLGNRIGSLKSILLPRGWRRVTDYRMAVLDTRENNPYYVFLEMAAKKRGYELRCFDNADDAQRWLQARS